MKSDCKELPLTGKQRDTLELLARGHTSKEMAQRLGVTASAIDQRIEYLLRTRRLNDRRELARWYQDTTVRIPTEKSQMPVRPDFAPTSISDRTASTADHSGLTQATAPQVFLLSSPEKERDHPSIAIADIRSTLELMFMCVVLIIGVAEIVKRAIA
jgi:DNA-binding CsgD family transcriptional regulator